MARLPYVDPLASTDEIKNAWEAVRISRGPIPIPQNLYKILAYSPAIMQSWSSFAQTIRGYDNTGELHERPGGLDPRMYKLIVLEVAKIAPNPYEWAMHKRSAHIYSISPKEIEDLEKSDFQSFTPQEKAVLAYVDDVVKLKPTDKSYAALTPYFENRTIVELTIAISFYVCIAALVNALQIEPETTTGPATFSLTQKKY